MIYLVERIQDEEKELFFSNEIKKKDYVFDIYESFEPDIQSLNQLLGCLRRYEQERGLLRKKVAQSYDANAKIEDVFGTALQNILRGSGENIQIVADIEKLTKKQVMKFRLMGQQRMKELEDYMHLCHLNFREEEEGERG